MQIGTDAYASVLFKLRWESEHAKHEENVFGKQINFWRDCFPRPLYEGLAGKEGGEDVHLTFAPEEVVPPYAERHFHKIKAGQFNQKFRPGSVTEPREGRFFPKGVLSDMPGIFKENREPFRCVGVNNGHIEVDFNHPLSLTKKPMALEASIERVWEKTREKGGSCIDWLETLTKGPGMQVRWRDVPTDFFSPKAFDREDEQADARFYRQPRLVNHLDEQAMGIVRNLYQSLLRPHTKVLDLMSSWNSHIPPELKPWALTGIGLNAAELSANPQLTDFKVLDLNQAPELPFEKESYHAVICTASVEYLVRPLDVFQEVARVLKPGGLFVTTFSDRWFPPKAIRIWKELHDFERMGLVMEYFMKTGRFDDLHTFSMRGLPRPEGDKYFPEKLEADPVYAVWGRKK